MKIITIFLGISFFLFANVNAQRPNVILILTDDQGWGDLSMNGNTNLNTPNIDQLAKEGVTFEKFYVASVCSPTRAEILTGRYHVRSGVFSTSAGGERIDLDETLMSDIFKEAGYRTAAFGKWHSGMQAPYHPNSRGFDQFYGFASGHWGNYFNPMLEHNGQIVQGEGFLPDDLTGHALSFMEEHKDEPFFLYLPFNTPHSPMQVPANYWESMKERPLTMFNRDRKEEDTLFTKAALAMVENIDDNVGRITAMIKKLNLVQNTIIVYLSDNGPNGVRWNGGMKGKKGTTDEGGVRSPLIMKWTGHLAEGTIYSSLASGIDLLPTLAELCGIKLSLVNTLDGVNVLEPHAPRIIYNYWQGRLSLRTEKFRLDHNLGLFDMEIDPGQTKDVRAEFQSEYKRLIDSKKKWMQEVASELIIDKHRPITIGHPSMKFYQIPARDALVEGGITRSNSWPNCSFFSNWTELEDVIYWDVEVVESGTFKVELYYTCALKNVGSEVELSLNASRLSATIALAHDPPLMGAENDVVPRMESYVKDFKPLDMGSIRLEKGHGRLSLRALDIPGKEVGDFRLLMLSKLD